MNVPSEHLLYLAAGLFAIGVLGFLIRRNVIVVLMCIELMLNAANLTFLAASRQHSTAQAANLDGPVFAIFVILVAACEAAVGLALIIALFRLKQSVEADSLSEMKG
ncbi:MAG: NADH-quinone oxidoreductase subunit NuoK [Planctomycetes bacterium]|nr:NADH-quinone oxidoreductase subunit NuoK [Planctomycetota bacterium]